MGKPVWISAGLGGGGIVPGFLKPREPGVGDIGVEQLLVGGDAGLEWAVVEVGREITIGRAEPQDRASRNSAPIPNAFVSLVGDLHKLPYMTNTASFEVSRPGRA